MLSDDLSYRVARRNDAFSFHRSPGTRDRVNIGTSTSFSFFLRTSREAVRGFDVPRRAPIRRRITSDTKLLRTSRATSQNPIDEEGHQCKWRYYQRSPSSSSSSSSSFSYSSFSFFSSTCQHRSFRVRSRYPIPGWAVFGRVLPIDDIKRESMNVFPRLLTFSKYDEKYILEQLERYASNVEKFVSLGRELVAIFKQSRDRGRVVFHELNDPSNEIQRNRDTINLHVFVYRDPRRSKISIALTILSEWSTKRVNWKARDESVVLAVHRSDKVNGKNVGYGSIIDSLAAIDAGETRGIAFKRTYKIAKCFLACLESIIRSERYRWIDEYRTGVYNTTRDSRPRKTK